MATFRLVQLILARLISRDQIARTLVLAQLILARLISRDRTARTLVLDPLTHELSNSTLDQDCTDRDPQGEERVPKVSPQAPARDLGATARAVVPLVEAKVLIRDFVVLPLLSPPYVQHVLVIYPQCAKLPTAPSHPEETCELPTQLT